MDKLINVLEKKLMPIANKISSIKFLNALENLFSYYYRLLSLDHLPAWERI